VYFDDPTETLNMVVAYDYDEDEEITVRDIWNITTIMAVFLHTMQILHL